MNNNQYTLDLSQLTTDASNKISAMVAELEGKSLCKDSWSRHFVASGKAPGKSPQGSSTDAVHFSRMKPSV